MKPWVYIAGGVVGAIIATLAFQFIGDGESASDVLPEIVSATSVEPTNTASSEPNTETSVEPQVVPERFEKQGDTEAIGDVVPKPAAGNRQAVERESAFSGYVVDADGQPIEGAVVSWTPIADEVMHPYSTFLSLREFVARETTETISDTKGEFAFEGSPEILTENGSVVWITHTRFAPRFFRLSSNADSWAQWSRYELASADAEVAIVIDEDGGGVGGATVRQFAISDASVEDSADEDEGGDVLIRLAYLLNRKVVTSPDGRCERHIFPGMQQVTAELEDVRATPWEGENENEITLALLPTITVKGAIDWSSFEGDRDQALIAIEVVVGPREILLEDLTCTSDSWGPLELPFYDGAEYRFRMDIPSLVPKEASAFPKRAGEEISIDFLAEQGEWIWYFVGDEADEPLVDAVGTFYWIVDGRRVEQRIGTLPRTPGYFAVPGCPPGVLNGEIACDGFQTKKIPPLTVPLEENLTQVIQLMPGGLFTGRCLLDGKPVENFEVSYWSRRDRAMRLSFEDREDGNFEINGAPLTKFKITAGVFGVGMSEIIQVGIENDRAEVVILNLRTGRSAVGTVVDHRTGQVISDATIQVMFSDRRRATGELGPRVPVKSDGSFEIEGFGDGAAVLAVEAPGYAKSLVPFSTNGDELTDVGVIRLSDFRSLRVEVRTTEDMDPTQIVVSLSGPQTYAEQAPDLDGFVVFDSIVPGFYGIKARLQDGTIRKLWAWLKQDDDDWFEELLFDGRSTVHIEVYPEPNSSLPLGLFVGADMKSPTGAQSITVKLDDSGRVSLSHLNAGEYQFQIISDIDSSSQTLIEKTVVLGHYDEQTVQFQLGEPACRFRVVDGNGQPISDVAVDVTEPGRTGDWEGVNRTDASGEFEVPGYTAPRMLLSLSHPVHGSRLAFEVDVDYTGKVTELVLEGSLDVSIVIQDADGPLVGVSALAGDANNTYNVRSSLTDMNGRAIFKKLTPGPYVIYFDHAEHWTYSENRELNENSGPIVITALRRCDLTIETYTNGLPRPNVIMDIGCTEASWDASHLLTMGRIDADQRELRTNGNGVLHLSRLPEGQLVWRVWLDEAHEKQIYATIMISPDEDNVLRIEVP